MTPFADYMFNKHGLNLLELSRLEDEVLAKHPEFLAMPYEKANKLVEDYYASKRSLHS